MTKRFHKIKECGCVVQAISCGFDKTKNKYLIGGHCHFTICNKCKKNEDDGDDTLYDMWLNDNITDDLEYAKWKEIKTN